MYDERMGCAAGFAHFPNCKTPQEFRQKAGIALASRAVFPLRGGVKS